MISRARTKTVPMWAIAAHTLSRVKETNDNDKWAAGEKKNIYRPNTRSALPVNVRLFLRPFSSDVTLWPLPPLLLSTLRALPPLSNHSPLAPPVKLPCYVNFALWTSNTENNPVKSVGSLRTPQYFSNPRLITIFLPPLINARNYLHHIIYGNNKFY